MHDHWSILIKWNLVQTHSKDIYLVADQWNAWRLLSWWGESRLRKPCPNSVSAKPSQDFCILFGSFVHVILRNPLRRGKMSGRRLNYSVAHPRSWVGCQPLVFHSHDTSFPNSGVYLLSVLSDNSSQELIHLCPGDWKDFHKDSRIKLHYEIYAKISSWPPYIAYLQSSRFCSQAFTLWNLYQNCPTKQ